jgi:hypothetical protein
MTDRKKTKVKSYKYCCEGHDGFDICENDNVIRAAGSLRSKKGQKFEKISGPSNINGKDKIYIHELKKYKSCNKYNTLHEDEVYSKYTKQINNLKKDYPAMKRDDLLVLLEKHEGHAGNVKGEISKMGILSKKEEEEVRQKYRKVGKRYSDTRKKKTKLNTSDGSRTLSANKKKKGKKSKKKKKKKKKTKN